MCASGEYIFSSPLSTSFPRNVEVDFSSYCSFVFHTKFIRTRKLWTRKLLAICVIDVYFKSFANLCAYILWQITDGLSNTRIQCFCTVTIFGKLINISCWNCSRPIEIRWFTNGIFKWCCIRIRMNEKIKHKVSVFMTWLQKLLIKLTPGVLFNSWWDK